MEVIKKSFNINGDLAQRIDDFIRENPGVSFTLLVNQALLQWLKNPQIALRSSKKLSEEDVKKFLQENAALMDDLSK